MAWRRGVATHWAVLDSVRRHRIALPERGVEIAVLEWPGDGPPVLLHHANGFSAALWDPCAQRLRARYRLFAIDARGHGDSSRPEGEAAFDWQELVEDLAAVGRALQVDLLGGGGERGETFALGIGHSFGGMLALRATLAHPDRVASLVLMSTSCEAPDLYTRETFVKAGGFAENKGMLRLQARLEELGKANDPPLAPDATQAQRDWRDRYWAHHRLRLLSLDPFACSRGAPIQRGRFWPS